MDIDQRKQLLDEIARLQASGELTFGQATLRLRKEITGLQQERFARMCKISLRSLRQLEQDEGNPTLATLNAVFGLFGMRIGLVRG
ncbi:helix-turn-helix domain-containing protein [Thiopseudomonas denitrificans]|uniref:Helix-turn-helix protein n=1 Tax=Thiopseudomonas denitrificans TaxID=1501432 RepID=A0A4R6U6J2_9GAMM|nr:helix-turn-helix transcriptional regulator [Thiopseudomonas denitrificans]TDQ40155.1 helix-turn-helix protein [Thiopseudomonas denitrificans]